MTRLIYSATKEVALRPQEVTEKRLEFVPAPPGTHALRQKKEDEVSGTCEYS